MDTVFYANSKRFWSTFSFYFGLVFVGIGAVIPQLPDKLQSIFVLAGSFWAALSAAFNQYFGLTAQRSVAASK